MGDEPSFGARATRQESQEVSAAKAVAVANDRKPSAKKAFIVSLRSLNDPTGSRYVRDSGKGGRTYKDLRKKYRRILKNRSGAGSAAEGAAKFFSGGGGKAKFDRYRSFGLMDQVFADAILHHDDLPVVAAADGAKAKLQTPAAAMATNRIPPTIFQCCNTYR